MWLGGSDRILVLYIVLIMLGIIFMREIRFLRRRDLGKMKKFLSLLNSERWTNRKDKNGNLLPDEVRLNKYGDFFGEPVWMSCPKRLIL